MQPTQALISLRLVTRIAAVVILSAVAIGFFLPSDYKIERSIQVPNEQYDLLQERLYNPKAWSQWMYIESGNLILQDDADTLSSDVRYLIQYQDASTKQGELNIISVTSDSIRFLVKPNQKTKPIPNVLNIHENANGEVQLDWVIEGELDAGFLGPYLALFANNIAGSNIEKSLSALAGH
ncbi:hypothetical protein [Marinomonas ostreistagni]|uniref:Polyketide cyclase n=1 Tax=Marinomonas ostreistagni TaxID=359209 RepID=A0ABS0Z7C9_9GAMM|nr:hypothetical protein [Marinomonas ostreistagni]MBJ7549544.1 hypothetical protein [Marinomonas ostreistagni]